MSHLTSIKLACTDKTALVAALRDPALSFMGFANCEVHDNPVALRMYSPSQHATAEIVARGVGSYRTDVGFRATPTGFELVTDADSTYQWPQDWREQLAVRYGLHGVLQTQVRELQAQGFSIVGQNEDADGIELVLDNGEG